MDAFDQTLAQHGLKPDGTKAAVDLFALAALEQRASDGYTPCEPGLQPCRVHAGDRLWVHVEAPGRHVYAIGVRRQATYRGLFAAEPREAGLLWPRGLVLDAETADMDALLVVASLDPLPWARDLGTAHCDALVGTMPPAEPTDACGHLYGLFWKIPPAIRGLVEPPRGVLRADDRALPAQKAAHSGSPYTAVRFQFKPAA